MLKFRFSTIDNQLELTLDDVKWAIVAAKKLKIKQEVCVVSVVLHSFVTKWIRQSITVLPRRNRLRIYVDTQDKFYRLQELKRGLPEIVVKV